MATKVRRLWMKAAWAIGLSGSLLAAPAWGQAPATDTPARFDFLTTALGPVRVLKAADGFVYAGVNNRLQVYDTSEGSRAKLVHEPKALHDHIADIAIDGSRLYLAAESDGLVIQDRSDPAKPKFLGRLKPERWAPTALAVAGSILFAAGAEGGIAVVDVADPQAPRMLARTSAGILFQALAYHAPYLHAADKTGRLIVYDATVPTALERVGVLKVKAPIQQIAVSASGGTAYLAAGAAGLRIVDVTDPSNPSEVGSSQHHPGAEAMGVALSGTLALVADHETKVNHRRLPGGLRILDVSDPADPKERGTVAGSLVGVDAQGQRAYIGVHDPQIISTIDVIDITKPDAPVRLMSEYLPLPDGSGTHIGGNDILFADYSLARFNLDRPDRPHLRWTREVARVGSDDYYGAQAELVVSEGMAYAFASKDTIQLFDISNLDRPRTKASITLRGGPLAATGGYLYAKDYLDGVNAQVYDVRDPDHPVVVGSIADTGTVTSGFVYGHYLYLTGYRGGGEFSTYDVTDPAAPVFIQRGANPGQYKQVVGDRLYTMTGTEQQTLHIYSLAAAPELEPLGAWQLPVTYSSSLSVCGTTAFLGSRTHGGPLLAADVSDPAAPFETARYQAKGKTPYSATCTDNNAVAVDMLDGLQILRYVPPSAASPR